VPYKSLEWIELIRRNIKKFDMYKFSSNIMICYLSSPRFEMLWSFAASLRGHVTFLDHDELPSPC
jgi:hypothetical protein